MFIRRTAQYSKSKHSANVTLEYFPHGTLDKYISIDLQEVDARIIALQLLEGLKLMHEEGFTHRDLKPQVRKCRIPYKQEFGQLDAEQVFSKGSIP